MHLPRGVTGFGHVEPGVVPPAFAAFKAACNEAARRLNGAVLRAESCEGRVTPNFHRVSLSLPGGVVEVICNARYPLAAAVELLEGGNIMPTFLDMPGLADVMAEFGFE